MSTKIRCRDCGKLFGELTGPASAEATPVACQVTETDLLFTVKCPRCGKFSFVKIELNK